MEMVHITGENGINIYANVGTYSIENRKIKCYYLDREQVRWLVMCGFKFSRKKENRSRLFINDQEVLYYELPAIGGDTPHLTNVGMELGVKIK